MIDQYLSQQLNSHLKEQDDYDTYVDKVMEEIEDDENINHWMNLGSPSECDTILDRYYKQFQHCLNDQVYKMVAKDIMRAYEKTFEY